MFRCCFRRHGQEANNEQDTVEHVSTAKGTPSVADETAVTETAKVAALFDDNIFSTILQYSNVLDLEEWKPVSNGFNTMCSTAIKGMMCQNRRRAFQTKDELQATVWKYYKIKYKRGSYNGNVTKCLQDAEEIATKYGWIIGEWDVSKITDFSYIFSHCPYFNESIGSWDVSNATSMRGMFAIAHSFNQDLSSWDTSNVTNMSYMFYRAMSFNQDISNWNTSKVHNMMCMFCGTTKFHHRNVSDHWDTSNVSPSLCMPISCVIHSKRVTIAPKDMQLASRVSG